MQQLIHLLKMAMVPYLPKILDLLEKCWTVSVDLACTVYMQYIEVEEKRGYMSSRDIYSNYCVVSHLRFGWDTF